MRIRCIRRLPESLNGGNSRMFNNSYLTSSGVRVYTSVRDNVAGLAYANPDDPQVMDLLRKCRTRGRDLMSENSEDALSWSLFHALSSLPTRQWLTDFFSAAVNESFALKYADSVNEASIRFWVPHKSPSIYLRWLKDRMANDQDAVLEHLGSGSTLRIARDRLEKILAGDTAEIAERPTEVDIEIRIPGKLLVFIEAKLYSDISTHGTFNPVRNQIVRNMELLEDAAQYEGFPDRRFIVLTLNRRDSHCTEIMRRYRAGDMKALRKWDEPGRWKNLKEDLPHRSGESDEYFVMMTKKMGWILWTDCVKLLAHHFALSA